ncbi:membrane protein insertase YidC [Nocardioides sp. JQ2195]|uniref:membrane protein insertase YidC n=1 Tax=Nocardioides sp. JQ2195 TaxID=2592334 RepID=UPI00143EDF12|nr:membrane protein insertase YidC [Nocardioides sp. JQ2195]QIX28511.1 membrane protein insertase YidC [Nocardioides sp. JQ2195]
MSFIGDIGHFIMVPLYYVISVVLVGFHKLFSTFMDPASGAAWALSIVGLTLVIRAALIPLFVKQIKSSRNMQLLQPKVKELQKKYGHDRERLAQETMALYKEAGTNPFASCLPILLQMPIFLALFRLLDQAAKHGKAHGVLNETLAKQFGNSELFGVPIAGTFLKADGDHGLQVLALFFVLAMLVTTFTTQRQLMTKNMPASAMTGPYAQQQKMMLYVLPVVFAIGGVAFPIGVLIYWTVSNLWTMGQQFYVIRNNPVPGTPAAEAKAERDKHKAERKALKSGAPVQVDGLNETAAATEEPKAQPRVQPKKQTRSQRNTKKKNPPNNRS